MLDTLEHNREVAEKRSRVLKDLVMKIPRTLWMLSENWKKPLFFQLIQERLNL